jgi:hypothetical protein
MKANLFETTFTYGIIPPIKKQFSDFNLYDNDNTLPTVYLQKIKIWFGKHKNGEKIPKSLLGIKCWYVNLLTKIKKETEYHGCELKSDDVESKELEININDGDYFNKINIGYDYYITHFKITTKLGKCIDFGEIDDNYEKKIGMNLEDNMVLFFSGYYSSKGIRAIQIKYIKRKDFVFYRIFDFLKIRRILQKDENKKEFYLNEANNNNLDKGLKCILKACLTPDSVFSCIIKYL